jgi:hypothetical protein
VTKAAVLVGSLQIFPNSADFLPSKMVIAKFSTNLAIVAIGEFNFNAHNDAIQCFA